MVRIEKNPRVIKGPPISPSGAGQPGPRNSFSPSMLRSWRGTVASQPRRFANSRAALLCKASIVSA